MATRWGYPEDGYTRRWLLDRAPFSVMRTPYGGPNCWGIYDRHGKIASMWNIGSRERAEKVCGDWNNHAAAAALLEK